MTSKLCARVLGKTTTPETILHHHVISNTINDAATTPNINNNIINETIQEHHVNNRVEAKSTALTTSRSKEHCVINSEKPRAPH